MICTHLSIKNPVKGNESTCIKCQAIIIHDGNKWRWLYEIDAIKARKLRTIYEINKLAGLGS